MRPSLAMMPLFAVILSSCATTATDRSMSGQAKTATQDYSSQYSALVETLLEQSSARTEFFRSVKATLASQTGSSKSAEAVKTVEQHEATDTALRKALREHLSRFRAGYPYDVEPAQIRDHLAFSNDRKAALEYISKSSDARLKGRAAELAQTEAFLQQCLKAVASEQKQYGRYFTTNRPAAQPAKGPSAFGALMSSIIAANQNSYNPYSDWTQYQPGGRFHYNPAPRWPASINPDMTLQRPEYNIHTSDGMYRARVNASGGYNVFSPDGDITRITPAN